MRFYKVYKTSATPSDKVMTDVGGYTYGNSARPYQVTTVTPYGNAIPLREQDITYNAMERPATITENGYTATFSYNANGNRVKMLLKNGSATELTRYYFGNKYEIDQTLAGTKEILYLCGDYYTSHVVMVRENSSTWQPYYIGRDYLGSITHVISASGAVQQELSYDAWGNLRDPKNHDLLSQDHQPDLFLGRGYTGHEHLAFCGLINMNARLYEPAVGRFISPDPYIQDATNTQNYNRYTYCLNNPLKYTDPSGEVIYTYDTDFNCYVNEWGERVSWADAYQALFENGYFRGSTSIYNNTNTYGFSGYPGVLMGGSGGLTAGYVWVSVSILIPLTAQDIKDGVNTTGSPGVISIAVLLTEMQEIAFQMKMDAWSAIGIADGSLDLLNSSLKSGLSWYDGLRSDPKQAFYHKLSGKINVKQGTINATVKSSVKSIRSFANGAKTVGRGVAIVGFVATGIEFFTSDMSGADVARLVGSGLILSANLIPVAGPFISAGLGIADGLGAFDGIYNYFD